MRAAYGPVTVSWWVPGKSLEPAAAVRRPSRMSTSGSPSALQHHARHHRTKIAVLGTAVAATALTGCTIDLAALPAAIPAAALAALVPFDACDDALDYLQREAATRVGPYGLDQGYGWAWSGGDTGGSTLADAARVTGAPAADGSSGYSGTNNQEVGVDEADLVKTDGEYLYTVVDGVLRVTDVRGGAPELVGELVIATNPYGGVDGPAVGDMMIGFGPSQLLLEGDLALVLMTQPRLGPNDARRIPSPGWGGWSESVVVSVDLSDPTAPRETARLSVDGDYLSARLVDGTARVVVRSTPTLPFETPYSEVPDADWTELEAAAAARNREVVADSTIDQWLPSYTLESGDEERTGQLVPCERVSHPVDFSGFAAINVLTIPLGDDSRLDTPLATSVLGDGETVYASTDRLYVVTNRWASLEPIPLGLGDAGVPSTTTTGIHAFDITGTGAATHVASGEVDGRVIGQYALSEHEGVLRVATTTDEMWSGGAEVRAPDALAPSTSTVTTLGEQDGELVVLGSIGGLGKGEQIYAVRYFGDTAYVVTFRQTDPLYVIDLADPENPVARGELKISGYSAYLHPLGADRLVGVGQEATAEGRAIGLQVSLFDTTDPTAPTKVDGEVLPGAWSDAEWDPHAFLSWEPTNQIMVPVAGDRKSGLLVLSVTADGFVQDGLVAPAPSAQVDSYTSPTRSVVVDDRLYTIWWNGVQGNDLDTLEPLGWAPFS